VLLCISENMVASFFMKPLQGKCFIRMRNIILNTKTDDDSGTNIEHRSVLDNIAPECSTILA
jgi:hypothetical protein